MFEGLGSIPNDTEDFVCFYKVKESCSMVILNLGDLCMKSLSQSLAVHMKGNLPLQSW